MTTEPQPQPQPHRTRGGRVRRVVPLRTVFPWWFLAGTLVTLGVAIVLETGSGGAIMWGPVIGLEIRDRWQLAARRQDDGLPVERRDLVGQTWSEPVMAVVFTIVAVGLGLTLARIVSGGAPWMLVVGLTLLALGAAAFGACALMMRRLARRAAGPPAG